MHFFLGALWVKCVFSFQPIKKNHHETVLLYKVISKFCVISDFTKSNIAIHDIFLLITSSMSGVNIITKTTLNSYYYLSYLTLFYIDNVFLIESSMSGVIITKMALNS